MSSLTTAQSFLPEHGLSTEDIRYFKMESHMKGQGPLRLKKLDVEGRWILSSKSIPFINAAFNHLEKLSGATLPLRDITDEPLNAIGLVNWTGSSTRIEKKEATIEPEHVSVEIPIESKKTPKKFVLKPPVVVEEEEVPPSPREVVPHRSAGYGLAHQKRKLQVPDRSRSPSPISRGTSPQPVYDKFAKYERKRKDSITSYGTKWGDAGYESSQSSPNAKETYEQPPHRTPALSSRPPSRNRMYDNEYDPEIIKKTGDNLKEQLEVITKERRNSDVPFRTHGYGEYHAKRQYNVSPRSLGSDGGSSSGSEISSPVPKGDSPRSALEVVLKTYHSKSIRATGPRRDNEWIRK